MATFTIKRLRPALQEKYRWSPIGATAIPLKINDYLDDGEVSAESVYHAWVLLKSEERALQVGDLLVSEDDKVFQCTYSGFEESTWMPSAEGSASKPNECEPGVIASATGNVQ
jgi:hypothetical protein